MKNKPTINIQLYTEADLDLATSAENEGPMGNCYHNAFSALARLPKGSCYVEGIAATSDLPIPLEHGWCITPSGKIVDPTWFAKGPKFAYVSQATFTVEQALFFARKIGVVPFGHRAYRLTPDQALQSIMLCVNHLDE